MQRTNQNIKNDVQYVVAKSGETLYVGGDNQLWAWRNGQGQVTVASGIESPQWVIDNCSGTKRNKWIAEHLRVMAIRYRHTAKIQRGLVSMWDRPGRDKKNDKTGLTKER